MEELKQIETLTLRDFIHQEITKHHQKALEMLGANTEQVMESLPEIISKTSELIILQEIAYRLEYGFITEIGDRDLKEHLVSEI